MAGMGDGYVGTAEDSARIRRMGKKREEERKKFEEERRMRQERIDGAGLRKFGAASTEVGVSQHIALLCTFGSLCFHALLRSLLPMLRPSSMPSRTRPSDW